MSDEVEISKLLSTAIASCTKAENGDKAEEGRALDALKLLQKHYVTADLLVKTEGGKKIKKLGKHSSPAICAAAAAVVDAWKDCVRQQQSSSSRQSLGSQSSDALIGSGSLSIPALASPTPSQATSGSLPVAGSSFSSRLPTATNSISSNTAPQLTAPTPSSSNGRPPGQPAANPQSFPPPAQQQQQPPRPSGPLRPARTGDETRDKIRLLLAEALAVALDDPDADGDPCAAAVAVETALYRQKGGVNQAYKTKYRSLAFNLKDPKNPNLRRKVLMQQIPGDVLVELSAEELASDDMRARNGNIRELMKKECERGQQNAASTDMFQCGKCKAKKTTYYQLQTRSADEPMTTFVTCVACGNRWKFC